MSIAYFKSKGKSYRRIYRMRNPKEIFTDDGYEDYLYYLRAIEKGIFFITNMADDLLLDEDIAEALYSVDNILSKLKNNNGEKYED